MSHCCCLAVQGCSLQEWVVAFVVGVIGVVVDVQPLHVVAGVENDASNRNWVEAYDSW